MRALLIGLLLWRLCGAFPAAAAFYYVSPSGSDANTGASNSPFATIMRAQSAASNGDTVYLRGGTYVLNNSNLSTTNNPWAIVNDISKAGISYVAFTNERPVFNFSAVQPVGYRVTAFLVRANNCTFKGFDVVGVKVTIAGTHTQSENFRVTGSRNRFEFLVMRDGMANGWYLTGGSSNLVLNCDAYNNRGLDSSSYGNVDGFGVHPSNTSGRSNVIRGCRAWFNSDDGYDCINADAAVVFENCWAFYNGYTTNFANAGGDGNGFKSGGYGRSGDSFPTPVPRHATRFCLAVRNRVAGFYANHHTGGLDWISNTAYRNNVNYNLLCTLSDNLTDVPGYDHLMKNNLGLRGNTEVSNLGPTNDTSFNYFTLPVVVGSNDFMTFDENLLMAPRQANGDLPYVAFAQLVSGSDLVNVGTNTGYAFAGSAPDLGAFEYGIKPPPVMSLAQVEMNVILAGSGGPAGGTNYLMATTNVAIPQGDWSLIATGKFDSAGNVTFTNAILEDVEARVFRIRLP